jgi:Na+-driven multidrug efflux pump
MIPALFVIGQNNCLVKCLIAMRHPIVSLTSSFVAVCTHVLWLYLFVTVCDLKLFGVGLATFTTWTIQTLVCQTYFMNVKALKEAAFWPTANVFSHWGEYWKIACPSIMLGCPEWWSISILVFMAGYLGVNEQATLTVVSGLSTISYTFFNGFMVGICVLTGNNMGENKPEKALYYSRLAAKISIPSCFFFISLLFFFRKRIASWYVPLTNEEAEDVNSQIISCIGTLCLVLIPDSI